MVRSNNPYAASLVQWQAAIEQGRFDGEFERIYGREQVAAWRANYLEALRLFAAHYGSGGHVVVARCPGQMNVMGMHIDYGGMPSVRMAVRGADTLVVARAASNRRVRLASFLRSPGAPADRFKPIEIDLETILPKARVAERQALMDYAGQVCRQRLEHTGSALARDWSVLVEGQLVYLESYFRDRLDLGGFDGLVWSSVSPSGGMSSSSALVVATALATMGVHGLDPRRDMPEADLVDGLGTSEWMRGTRGGTADHGGMILGRAGKLIGVGVFPARVQGEAALPDEYAAIVLDSGVVREYDEAVKEETVIAYPLGAFIARELILPRLGKSQRCGRSHPLSAGYCARAAGTVACRAVPSLKPIASADQLGGVSCRSASSRSRGAFRRHVPAGGRWQVPAFIRGHAVVYSPTLHLWIGRAGPGGRYARIPQCGRYGHGLGVDSHFARWGSGSGSRR